MRCVAVDANEIIIHEMRKGTTVMASEILLPRTCTLMAASGVQNMLTKGTAVAIQEPSSVVVGIVEFGDCIIERIGDVHPVIIPV